MEGWRLLFEEHFREWRVTLGLDNSTRNRTRAELAFVWEVIQKTAVLFVYSRRLASIVGVYASQKLANDIIWDLGGKIWGLVFILPKNIRKRFSLLACMEWMVLEPFLVCMLNSLYLEQCGSFPEWGIEFHRGDIGRGHYAYSFVCFQNISKYSWVSSFSDYIILL